MTFELLPIYDVVAVKNMWPLLQEGFKKIWTRSVEPGDPSVVLSDLFARRALLWMGFCNGKYAGFAITIINLIGTDAKELFVKYVFIEPEVPREILDKGLVILEGHAKKMGCERMTFRTRRAEPFRKRLGTEWKEGLVEVYKEIGNGKE